MEKKFLSSLTKTEEKGGEKYMKTVNKKFFSILVALMLLTGTFTLPSSVEAVEPWDVSGSYDIAFMLTGDPTPYVHDANLTQTGFSVTGDGGYPNGGSPYTYHWNVQTGSVSGDTITLNILYDVGATGTVMDMTGIIASDGTMSGTWTDNFGGPRSGTWSTTEGAANRILPAECDGISFPNAPIMGTNGSDMLTGTGGNDVIFAMNGSDVVNGMGGNDCIVGGNGSDKLVGGTGNDVILGGLGSDSIQGDAGVDKLYGEESSDVISGGADSDELYGGGASDSLRGEGGNDLLDGGAASDSANGGAGTDTCTAESENSCEL